MCGDEVINDDDDDISSSSLVYVLEMDEKIMSCFVIIIDVLFLCLCAA